MKLIWMGAVCDEQERTSFFSWRSGSGLLIDTVKVMLTAVCGRFALCQCYCSFYSSHQNRSHCTPSQLYYATCFITTLNGVFCRCDIYSHATKVPFWCYYAILFSSSSLSTSFRVLFICEFRSAQPNKSLWLTWVLFACSFQRNQWFQIKKKFKKNSKTVSMTSVCCWQVFRKCKTLKR